MSDDLSTELAGWDGVCQSLAQIRASHEEFDQFFSGVFDELEALSGQLIEHQDTWLASRHLAESDLQRRAAELDQQRASLAARWDQLQQAAGRQSEGASDVGQQLVQMQEEARQDHAALQAAIETSQTQAAELARVVGELTEARSALAEARQEILRHREELSAQGPSAAVPEGDLQQELREADQQRQLLEQERAVLESELEAVRNRAAEMAETLAQQKRQMAQQSEQSGDELRRMRRLLERLSGQLAEQPPDARATRAEPQEVPEPAASETVSASSSTVGDAVLDSVMAQFQMLQKDRARRREKVETT